MNTQPMSKMTRFFAGATFSLILLLGAGAVTAQAANLTTPQINAVLSLLQAFGADSATIANVQAALNGTSSDGGGIGPGRPWCHTFSVDLKFGDRGEKVFWLQEVLRKEGFEVGNEQSDALSRSYFGEVTASAVVRFQAKYGIMQTGYVGPLTRAKLNSLYGCGIGVPVPPRPSPIYQIYDYNSDGKVDQSDVQFLLEVAVGSRTCPSGRTCDVNRDGKVLVSDSLALAKYIND